MIKLKTVFVGTIVLIAAVNSFVCGQGVTEEWVSLYQVASAGESAKIAIDANSNIYVTGMIDNDIATIKYGPDSNEPVWIALYDGPGNGIDIGTDIAVDKYGNIYVTGPSESSTDIDYVTIKYGPDTNEPVWVARYDGPTNFWDEARAIAVDDAGNVYVTGSSQVAQSETDFTTVKYDPNGAEVWVAMHKGDGDNSNVEAKGNGIIVDDSGDIYVTGVVDYAQAESGNYTTIKYGPDSNEPVWIATYDGHDSVDIAWAIALDSSGNVYVTGESYSGDGYKGNCVTIKYGPDSNEALWIGEYDGPGDGPDVGFDIAGDDFGNVYVTGRSYDPCGFFDGTYDFATIKYSSDSNQPVWVARYDIGELNGDWPPDWPPWWGVWQPLVPTIAVDESGDIYCAGYVDGNETGRDFVAIKYGPDSNEPVWVVQYNSPGNEQDRVSDIAVDDFGKIYVTGKSTLGYWLTIKYSQERSGVSLVKNGSFEADGAISDISADEPRYWCDVDLLSGKFEGFVSDIWSSHDGNSVTLCSKALEQYNAGEMGKISQEVYLEEDANEIIFDLKLSTSSGVWDATKRSAVMLIDGVIIWDSNDWAADSNDEYWNQSVYIGDVNGAGDTNLHTLTLGIRSNVTETVLPSYVEYRTRWDFVKFNAYCGGFGYLPEDFSRDCYVNFVDYAMLANYWLEEVAGPNDIYDLTEDDGVVDMNDIGIFTAGWLDNSDWRNWGDGNCYQADMLEADLNGDGIVNFKDYGILAGEWLNTGDCIGADIDCSGTVGWEDVSRMAGEWLMRDWLYGL